jgi:RNA polymerase sigma-70 factor (ECF subfamily)
MLPNHDELAHWFAAEVLPHEAALRTWLSGRFPFLRDIDDVIQECYARLCRARRTGSIACPRAFLFVTARNLALNHLRHQRCAQSETGADCHFGDMLDEGITVAESVAHAEDLQLLIAAIHSLPGRCRQVMTLRKIYGLSQKEVAAQLGLAVHTVEVQTGIGVRKCVEFFRRRGYRCDSRP